MTKQAVLLAGMTPHEDEQQSGAYWTLDVPLGDIIWQGEPITVRMKARTSHERYTEPPAINPLLRGQGERTYLLTHLYMPVPDIHLMVGMHATPSADDAIGAVLGLSHQGVRHEFLGWGQAWYYPADHTILLWELMLLDRYRTQSLLMDMNLATLWQGFEAVLCKQFLDADRIVTPAWEPEYDTQIWQQFLASLGYTPHLTDEQTFIKNI